MIDLHRRLTSISSVESDEGKQYGWAAKTRICHDGYLDNVEEWSDKESETSFVAECEAERMTLTWSNISVDVDLERKKSSLVRNFRQTFCKKTQYKQFNKKRILKDVTGLAKPGRVLAIMGASGSGKTTLLNILTRRNIGSLIVDGDIRLNGREISGSEIRAISAYVQQEDLFIGTLKVKEHLQFQAILRLGDKFKESERNKIVDRVLTELGLVKCENTMIGVKNQTKGISGGERKRLAFASEILTNPALMFCDEPTSGLDSFMAQQVVAVLKNMAVKGKTIICTIHQPSSQVFRYFDDLCLLSNGHAVYMGPTKEVPLLFERAGMPCPKNFNPADHYIRSLAIDPTRAKEGKQRVKKIKELYKSTDTHKKVVALSTISWRDEVISLPEEEKPKKRKYKTGWITQYKALLWRSWVQNYREPLLVNVRLFETIVIALLFGLLYFKTVISAATIQNINGLLFMFPIQTSFSFTFAVVHVFCEELPIFLREYSSNLYRVDAYFLAKNISELPQFIIFPFLFSVIVYFMAGLTPVSSTFFILAAIDILTTNIGISLGYAVSTAFIDLNLATTVLPILIIPFMIFGGFYVNSNTVPVYFSWLQYVSFLKYSYESIAINQWQTVHSIPGCENSTCPHNGTAVLETLHFDPNSFDTDIIVMCVMLLVLKFLAFFNLLIRTSVNAE